MGGCVRSRLGMGARRRTIVIQFLGEALIFVADLAPETAAFRNESCPRDGLLLLRLSGLILLRP